MFCIYVVFLYVFFLILFLFNSLKISGLDIKLGKYCVQKKMQNWFIEWSTDSLEKTLVLGKIEGSRSGW